MFNYNLIEKYNYGNQIDEINNILDDEITSFSDIFNNVYNKNDYLCKEINILPTISKSNCYTFLINNSYDVIKDINIYISNCNENIIEDVTLYNDLKKIESCNNIQQQIYSFITNKKIEIIGQDIIIPFSLFFDTIPHYLLNEVINIDIITNKICNIKIIAKVYKIKNKEKIPNTINMDFLTIQSICNCIGTIKKGINKIQLSMNCPIFLFYFYLPKEKIKNVKLLINNEAYYDGPINNLSIDSNLSIILFSNELDKNNLYLNKSLQFSNINKMGFSDNLLLIIDTDQEEETKITIGALNYNVGKIIDGKLYSPYYGYSNYFSPNNYYIKKLTGSDGFYDNISYDKNLIGIDGFTYAT